MNRSGLVPLEFGRMYVRDEGQGEPPLLLLHGLLLTHHAFRRVVEPFAAGRRVIVPDLPGCGESDRPAPEHADGYGLTWLGDQITALLDALGVEHLDVLGHSLGGALAADLAIRHPRRIRKLVLVDALCFPLQLDLLARVSLLPVVGPVMFEHVFRRADIERHLRRSLAAPETLEPLSVDVYWDRLAREGGRAAAHAILQNVERLERMHDRLPGVLAPTLVVWGDRDVIVPREHAERLVAEIEDARLAIVEGCGHAPAEERPDELVRLVEGFLAD